MAWSVMEGCAVEGGVGTVFGVLGELKAYLPSYACGFPKGGSLSGTGEPLGPLLPSRHVAHVCRNMVVACCDGRCGAFAMA